MKEAVHVAVGVVLNPRREVLIALRGEHLHQGGLWEFPGGKVEEGEDAPDALARELLEEVALSIQGYPCSPLLRVSHDYGDKQVLLDVWLVEGCEGDAAGAQGQQVRWVALDALDGYPFPAANAAILEHLKAIR